MAFLAHVLRVGRMAIASLLLGWASFLPLSMPAAVAQEDDGMNETVRNLVMRGGVVIVGGAQFPFKYVRDSKKTVIIDGVYFIGGNFRLTLLTGEKLEGKWWVVNRDTVCTASRLENPPRCYTYVDGKKGGDMFPMSYWWAPDALVMLKK